MRLSNTNRSADWIATEYSSQYSPSTFYAVGIASSRPAITSVNSATFTVTAAGTFTVTSTGVPAPTLSESGALPAGLTFNASTGVLSGTPAAGTIGSYAVTFTAQNGVVPAATQNFSLTVNPVPVAPAITSDNNVTFSTGTASSFTVIATGVPAPSISESGTLPTGVSFNPASGVLSGTPATGTGGPYSITFTAHNGIGSDATQSFTLTVNQKAAITSFSRTKFTVGTANSFTVTATGFPTPILSESGGLPTGVTFNPATGALTGTPAAGTTGNYPVTFNAHNGVGTDATQSFTLTVNQVAAITSVNTAIFSIGTQGSFTVTTTGSPTPSLSESGALPAGITFTKSTGVLSGTPAAGTGGTYLITFTAHNGVGTDAVQNFTLVVGQSAVITSANAVTFGVGALNSFTVTASGSPAPSLSETGTLPTGVAFNSSTGIFSGTPAAGTAGSYPITLTAHNGIGADGTQNFTLSIVQASIAPSINSPASVSFFAGTLSSFLVTVTGSPTPTLSQSGALPAGVTFNASSGVLSGIPGSLTGGAYPITFTADNGVGTDAVQNFTLTVNAAPVITTQPTNQTVNAGQTATFMVAVTGTAPLTYQWQRNGINIGTSSSTYTTPITTGADDGAQFTVTVSNSSGMAVSNVVTLSVNTAPSITAQPSSQTIAVGESATFAVSISVTGTLPLNFQWFQNNVAISGATTQNYTTPVITTQAASGEQFSVVVSNSLGTAPSNAATMTVVSHPSPAIYYIDGQSGLDTNSGLSSNSPWQNAPGMNGCGFNCNAYILQPGDKVVFKGGAIWTAQSFPLNVTASGAGGNPIVYGVDPTWFTGTTWTRPIFDLTNGTWSTAPVQTNGAAFVTFDNLEIMNAAFAAVTSADPRGSVTINNSSNVTIQNCYIHGWSLQNPVLGSDYPVTGGIAFYDGSTAGTVQNCVLDGSPESDSGTGIYGGTFIQGNIIENVPNGIVVTDPAANIHGNQIFDIAYSVDPLMSSNGLFAYTSAQIYNNIIHDLVEGASAIVLESGQNGLGNTQFVYNNLVWNVGDSSPITIGSDGVGPNVTSNQYIYNNTLSGGSTSGCVDVNLGFFAPTNLTVENNHCISDLPSSQAWCWNNAGGNINCGTITNLIFLNNILQPTSAAASQGYTVANSFQAAASNGATVGVGMNLSSICSANSPPLCSDRLGVTRPAGSAAWDAGAYLRQAVVGNLAPSITMQPARQGINAGQTATFSVVATGSATLTYQWQKNGTAIAGATSSAYTTPAMSSLDDGAEFTVVVSNSFGNVVSSPATVSVNSVAGQLVANPSSLNFGTLGVGSASAASVTLSNTSSSFITISNVSVSIPGVSASGVPTGIIMAPGETATLNVIFAPANSGSVAGNIIFNSDATNSPTTVPVSGTAVQPLHSVTLTWNPSSALIFGYNVYRATNPNGPYTQLNLTPVSTIQFVDLNVLPGTTYLYWVTSTSPDSLETPFSSPVQVTIPAP